MNWTVIKSLSLCLLSCLVVHWITGADIGALMVAGGMCVISNAVANI